MMTSNEAFFSMVSLAYGLVQLGLSGAITGDPNPFLNFFDGES